MVGINDIVKAVNGRRNDGEATGNELVSLPREQGLARAAELPPQELAHQLSGLRRPSDLAHMVSLIPADKICPVLMQDERVFAEARSWDQFPDSYDNPQGPVERLTRQEFEKLCDAGHRVWLVPIEYSDLGEPVTWGLRFSLNLVSKSEVFERIEDIIESDNDNGWKAATLKALPPAYVALALQYVKMENEIQADTLIEKIRDILDQDIDDEGLVNEVETLIYLDEQTLHRRLIEAREAVMADAATTITLTGKAAEIKEQIESRGSVRSLLDEIRGE